ncbi:MAG TPA: hypothetical protein PLZ57_02470 [Pseudobdellovibrionaceae bacterium]|nr:hypothetical protein [Pseudobdellovibrionaceae bacterium]
MPRESLDGSLVMEKLAELGQVDEFLDAIDADDLTLARSILTRMARHFNSNAKETEITEQDLDDIMMQIREASDLG